MEPRPPVVDVAERRWWMPALACGLLAAIPFAAFRYLPLVDFPLHQLELAIWLEPAGGPEGFDAWYADAGAALPYWFTLVLGGALAPLLGVEAAARAVVALYALALPLAGGLLARAAGRSGWWGLLLAPFVLEYNLSFGYVAYCVAGLLVLLGLTTALHAERAARPGRLVGLLAVLALAVGWTHPQMAVGLVGWVAGLEILNRGGGLRRRAAIAAATLPALGPSLVWFSRPERALQAFGRPPEFAAPGVALERLALYSVDVFPGSVEEGVALLALGALLIAWLWFPWRDRPRPPLRDHRFALAALGFLVLYFVTPTWWNGQEIAQRMPYLALLCLPALAPPRTPPTRALRLILVSLAAVGVLHAGLVVYGFHRETAAGLDPLVAIAPERPRLAYAAYDIQSPWVKPPVYTHAGAWITLRKGGVYAFHFNRLTSRHRDSVPPHQTFIGREFLFSRRVGLDGGPLVVPRRSLAFWNTFLVRWPPRAPTVVPVAVRPDEVVRFERAGDWGLLHLRDAPADRDDRLRRASKPDRNTQD